MITRAIAFLIAAATMITGVAQASPVDASLRPVARPQIPQEKALLRPKLRPETGVTAPTAATSPAVADFAPRRPQARPISDQQRSAAMVRSPGVSLRPLARPDAVVQQAQFWKRKKRKGAICGIVDIQGDNIGDVPAKLNGCGVTDAVRVRSVSGVALNPPAVMNCQTAQALNKWVDKGVKPALSRLGPVVEMRVAAGYNCRTRNNIPGAKVSEHGKGKALDISAFTLQDGAVITVTESWGKGAAGRALRKIWKSACGPFGTVLGPNADRYHQTHFHVDTASYRSGSYCK